MASQQGGGGDTSQVLLEDHGCARILILNRPRQLNALSSQMVSKLLKLFAAYEDDPAVKLLIMKGQGRAFCAGGDVAAVVRSVSEAYHADVHPGENHKSTFAVIKRNSFNGVLLQLSPNNGSKRGSASHRCHWSYGANFFWKEFILNYIIATYRKPQVSILNGIVMGGGAGVSIHGRFRVATENSVFAMPETALGLFPDIGASYFLSRLPGYFGEYVGLTGVRLDGAEMLACGLATHFVPSARLSMLEESLIKKRASDLEAVSAIINEFSHQASLKETSAYNRLDIIDRCFSKRTVEDIIYALEQEGMSCTDEWIKTAIQSLKKASPSSLKISLRSIRQGRFQGIDQCLIREYRMVCHVLRREISKDFFEGCRALLVDKDKNPKWEPSKLELISEEMVDRYFDKVDDPEWEDLKLPLQRSTNVLGISKL